MPDPTQTDPSGSSNEDPGAGTGAPTQGDMPGGAPALPAAGEPTTTTEPPAPNPAEDAEVAKWREIARKHEARSKAADARAKEGEKAIAELAELQRQALSESERAVIDARSQGRAEAIKEFGKQLVDAKFRVAAAGRLDGDRLDVLLGALDLGLFLNDDGTVKGDQVDEFVNGIAPPTSPATGQEGQLAQLIAAASAASNGTQPPAAAPPAPPTDLGQGAGRGDPNATALNGDPILADLKRLLHIK